MKKIFFLILLCASFFSTKASHLFGGEIYYDFISGTTYKINVVFYADCSTPNQQLLTNLLSANPVVVVYKNTTFYDSLLLTFNGPAVDVTPVCPGISTTCSNINNTVQGVKRYKYSYTYNLGSANANWRFFFNGNLAFGNPPNKTGRSAAITNVNGSTCGGAVTLMALEATLNNVGQTNNTPTYTTIPTPFFCINKPANYNQGAVDIDGDSLAYVLTPGLDGNCNGGLATYVAPNTATDPLTYLAGTFSFGTSTGQLAFTPNAIQNSLIVTKVTEYRNGIKVGTSMREMVFVVLNNCNNNPPGGNFGSTSVGVIDSSVNIYICKSAPTLVFTIPPVDADGNTITATVNGLPGNCTTTITGNSTTTPVITGTWTPTGGFVIGNYVFFVTYEDNGCPLTSKQTIAYTIHVLPAPTITTITTPPLCNNGGIGTITATVNSGNPAFTYTLSGGGSQSSNVFNNVAPGNYTVGMVDAKLCTATTVVSFAALPIPVISNIAQTAATCSPGCDGTFTVTATSPSNLTLSYSKDNGANFQAGNSFNNLCIGSYTIVVKDVNGCSKSSVITIVNPLVPAITSVAVGLASCAPGCDAIVNNITVTPAATYTFTLNGGSSNTNGIFNNTCVGTYTIKAADALFCTATYVITVTTPAGPIINSLSTANASCIPGCDGDINSILATSINGGITFKLNAGAYQAGNLFSGLCSNTYTLSAKDAAGCITTSTVLVNTQTPPTISQLVPNAASCKPGCDGTVSINATSPNALVLSYQIGNAPFQSVNLISNVCTGTYTFTVKDSKNCTVTSVANVGVADNPAITNANSTNITCYGKGDGSITISATGSGAIAYVLLPPNITSTTGTYTNLQQNNYTVLVSDAKGCTVSKTFSVIEPSVLKIDSVKKQDKTCATQNNGSIITYITGGTPPISFTLNPVAQQNFSGVFINLADNNYTVIVSDVNNCSLQTNVIILPPVNPLQITTTFNNVACNGFSTDGWAEVKATNGDSPYSYSWNTKPPQTTPRIENLYAGIFIVNVTDNFGCVETNTVELRDPAYCCELITIPNAFTPNQDDLNDKLGILTTTNIQDILFIIYDRWGNLVYQSNSLTEKWDGSHLGKETSDLENYFYMLRYFCNTNGKTYTKKGDVLLMK